MSREDLNQRTRDIADAAKPHLAIDATTNVTTVRDEKALEDAFSKFLPESLTMDGLKAGQEFTLDITAGLTLAHGELQQTHMAEHKDAPTGSLKVKLGFATIENTFERHRKGTAMGKDWEKFGISTTDVTLGTGRQRGEYKRVVTYLGAEAAKAFSN